VKNLLTARARLQVEKKSSTLVRRALKMGILTIKSYGRMGISWKYNGNIKYVQMPWVYLGNTVGISNMFRYQGNILRI